MAEENSRKCRKCGRVSEDSGRDGFVSFGRKNGNGSMNARTAAGG